ncbi:MAG: IS66 family insertion sequence element accessory protein TnpB [Roseomonas sp.]|nr:IS66 family insertion sequence element accessory protein TnpB [Roseomonas sp.]
MAGGFVCAALIVPALCGKTSPAMRWQGLCLFAKRLERGLFFWPMTNTGTVMLSAAQASMLLEGIDWRTPQRIWRPSAI